MQTTNDIRRRIRNIRRGLPAQARRFKSRSAAGHFITSIRLLRHQRIALYIAADGELDPAPLLKRLQALNKTLYLPVLRKGRQRALWFSEYRPDDNLQRNRFGIAEPDIRHRKPVPPWGLDLIIMPLVAFNGSGIRVGMGGGYYDRTLAYQRRHPLWRKPELVGYGYDFQQQQDLKQQAWDVPLHGIVTENRYLDFKSNR
ncbi:MAG: 5-formyltetrahydrofolate cyclo-ligase [Sedimenticola sp.]|nr:5-formyltetrahydrofolate cyclo-ligase [Sedimenticola sp.]